MVSAKKYDLARNRTQKVETVSGSPATTNYTYNAANQLTSDGTNTLTYDNNGNMASDGVNAYTWDRANRLLTMGGISYEYDGLGNRVQQTANQVATKYLLDPQPGLAVVLESETAGDATRYIHGPRGLERQQNTTEGWIYTVQDGLGSVRGVVGGEWPNMAIQGTRQYAPYGVPFGAEGTVGTAFGFTGEMVDANELVFLRARYLNPELGVFASLDPWEGEIRRATSLNGYGWVEGNVVNWVDSSGKFSASEAIDFGLYNRVSASVLSSNVCTETKQNDQCVCCSNKRHWPWQLTELEQCQNGLIPSCSCEVVPPGWWEPSIIREKLPSGILPKVWPVFGWEHNPAQAGTLGFHKGSGGVFYPWTLDVIPKYSEECIDEKNPDRKIAACQNYNDEPIPVYSPLGGCAVRDISPDGSSEPGVTIEVNVDCSRRPALRAEINLRHLNPKKGIKTGNVVPGDIIGYLCTRQEVEGNPDLCDIDEDAETHLAINVRLRGENSSILEVSPEVDLDAAAKNDLLRLLQGLVDNY